MKTLLKHLPVLILTIGVALFLSACGKAPSGDQLAIEEFAKCLSTSGAKEYGAYWCPHCQNQKKMFGEAFKFVTYIECSLPGGNGQNQTCKDAKIESYPTWEFKDGSRQSGVLSFATLAAKTGCAEPGKPAEVTGPPTNT